MVPRSFRLSGLVRWDIGTIGRTGNGGWRVEIGRGLAFCQARPQLARRRQLVSVAFDEESL